VEQVGLPQKLQERKLEQERQEQAPVQGCLWSIGLGTAALDVGSWLGKSTAHINAHEFVFGERTVRQFDGGTGG
jgi:hypothetical protein